jgi:hypothetical protein
MKQDRHVTNFVKSIKMFGSAICLLFGNRIWIFFLGRLGYNQIRLSFSRECLTLDIDLGGDDYILMMLWSAVFPVHHHT